MATTQTAAKMDTAAAKIAEGAGPHSAAPVAPASAPVFRPVESRNWVTLAHLVRPQGRHGELLAELQTDFPERFSERRRLYLQLPDAPDTLREVTLAEHWLHKGRLVLKFAGVDSIEQANALRGMDVVIPREERAPLDEDSVYISDLAGCVFFDRATACVVGEIVDVDRESANLPLIVVRGSRGEEVLIPFAKAYEPRIDLPNRRMEMTLPEGLLTLDTPPTPEERAAALEAQPAATTKSSPGQRSGVGSRRRRNRQG